MSDGFSFPKAGNSGGVRNYYPSAQAQEIAEGFVEKSCGFDSLFSATADF